MGDMAELREAYRIALRRAVQLDTAKSLVHDTIAALNDTDDAEAQETLGSLREVSLVLQGRHKVADMEHLEALKAWRAGRDEEGHG